MPSSSCSIWPTLIRVSTGAGHGGGRPSRGLLAEAATVGGPNCLGGRRSLTT